MDLLFGILLAVVAIAVVTALSERLGVAGPLMLVGVGLVVGLLPSVHLPDIEPDWILVGVLPPLLYSAAVNLPAIEFRRDFASISGLAVLLVVVSSLVLGVFFWLVIPGVGLPLGIALGAILSPTDAVATSIAKRLGISPRVITMLEGESLLNDATALVLLRTAIVAIAGSFSLWGAIGTFAWGVFIAIVLGAVIGWLLLRLRAWVTDSAANTAISFTAPFLAYLPTERLGGSGLVAAVVAGIVTAQGAARHLNASQRLSDTANWRTVELVLEGAVFLLMGLELKDIVSDSTADGRGLWFATWIALASLGIILVVRAAYVSFLVWQQGRRARRLDRTRLEEFGQRIDKMAAGEATERELSRLPKDPERAKRRLDGATTRLRRALADLDYYQQSPLGWKHGTVIVWSGMRGVVTLAAAQSLTLVETGGQRALLVLIAFLVALASLMLQGFTLPWLVRALRFPADTEEAGSSDQRDRLDDELSTASRTALADPSLTDRDGKPFPPDLVQRLTSRLDRVSQAEQAVDPHVFGELRLAMIAAQRKRLVELSSDGEYRTADLRHALAELDAEQLSIELRLGDG